MRDTEFECMKHGWRSTYQVCPFCMIIVLEEDRRNLKKKVQELEDEKNILPLGEQQLPVLIGRMKNSLNVTVQCDGRFIEIPAEWVRDVALGIVMVASEDVVEQNC